MSNKCRIYIDFLVLYSVLYTPSNKIFHFFKLRLVIIYINSRFLTAVKFMWLYILFVYSPKSYLPIVIPRYRYVQTTDV